jgi:hypothetical protein
MAANVSQTSFDCGVCGARFATSAARGLHSGTHSSFNVQTNLLMAASRGVDLAQVRDRIRFAVKDKLAYQTKPLPGNRVRAGLTLSLDMLETEFLAVFGAIPGFTLVHTKQRRNRRYTLNLRGNEIVQKLDPVLGYDWDNAERKDSTMMNYVLSVNVALDRHFPFTVTFSVEDVCFMERTSSAAPLIERKYCRGELRMSFFAATTSRRASASGA